MEWNYDVLNVIVDIYFFYRYFCGIVCLVGCCKIMGLCYINVMFVKVLKDF